MMIDVRVHHIRIQSDELDDMAGALRRLGEEIEDVKAHLARQSGFARQLPVLGFLYGRMEKDSRGVGSLSEALLDIESQYRRTEQSVEERFGERRLVFRLETPELADFSVLKKSLHSILYGGE